MYTKKGRIGSRVLKAHSIFGSPSEVTISEHGNTLDTGPNGVSDYADLLRRYDQNQKQYEELKARLAEREAEITNLQQLLQPVYDEYSDLDLRYNIEKQCRSKAEEYAGKIVKENKKLKRQSQMLLDQFSSVEINFEDNDFDTISTTSTIVEDQTEHLNRIIEDLQNEIVGLQQRVRQAEDERDIAVERKEQATLKYQQEHEARLRAQNSLQHYEQQLKQFNRVSTQALDEFKDLQKKLDRQSQLQTDAERFATKMLSERDAMARESSILIASAASDERLASALLEIEDLNKKLELEKYDHKEQVSKLQAVIDQSGDVHEVSDLENQLQGAVDQIESLQQQLNDAQKYSEKQLTQIEELQSKLEVAEEKLRPPAPPPPPPPPPLPPSNIFNLKTMIKQNKAAMGNESPKAKKKTGKSDPKYEEALSEMMNRIKQGVSLRVVKKQRPSLPDLQSQSSSESEKSPNEESAVNNLHKILSSVKRRSQSLGGDPSDPRSPTASDSNELMQAYNRIRGSSECLQVLSNRNLGLIEEVEEDKLSPKNSGDGSTGKRMVQLRSAKSNVGPPVSPKKRSPPARSQSDVVSTRM